MWPEWQHPRPPTAILAPTRLNFYMYQAVSTAQALAAPHQACDTNVGVRRLQPSVGLPWYGQSMGYAPHSSHPVMTRSLMLPSRRRHTGPHSPR